ncbi:nitrophenyl compound nitroreductase subunit ArsF family protein [bacterium]|nr:nitrophenyl compound nitroreductase subunit ArsF family protein [bacterium]
MKPKLIITLVLTIFVVGSIAAMIYKETRPASAPVSEQPVSGEQSAAASLDHQVVAYYLHGTARCVTCKKIEAYTEEALNAAFPEALQDGRLLWKVVNVEEPGNEHFVTDYKIHTKSVVLSDMQNGQEAVWKNLDQVWNLVQDKDAFIAYIQQETKTLLGENNG